MVLAFCVSCASFSSEALGPGAESEVFWSAYCVCLRVGIQATHNDRLQQLDTVCVVPLKVRVRTTIRCVGPCLSRCVSQPCSLKIEWGEFTSTSPVSPNVQTTKISEKLTFPRTWWKSRRDLTKRKRINREVHGASRVKSESPRFESI